MSQTPPFLPDNQPLGSVSHPANQPIRLPTEGAEALLVLPVIQEHLVIGRELVETGRVRLTRRVQETDEVVSVPVQHEEVQVERVALNHTLPAGTEAPAIRYEGDTMIIPVLREIAVVEKRLLLVEELRVTKRQVTTDHTETVHLRREDVHVEHRPAAPPEATT